MTPDREDRARAILDEALAKDSTERDAFIDAACASDTQLLEAVRTLQRAQAASTRILEESTEELPRPRVEIRDFRSGERIDNYTIREKIGKGAFGDVYLAHQEKPQRSVALKIIKLEVLSQRVLKRFEAEKQALARMNHPYIAKVFDAGVTPNGRPYFVMEYVKGVPITVHCDRHRVDIAGRLELFVKICDAVQHAHQKGVIHRDLKPSNLLVAFDGDRVEPKVIDFGVAKALDRPLTDDTLFTEIGQLIGTPEYMSPEQAEMSQQDIDSRSDIYSLGVLLYELLTGARPFDKVALRQAGIDGIRKIIREVEPQRPSMKLSTLTRSGSEESVRTASNRGLEPRSLGSRIRGDLDWITMKCLEKDRVRRYPSASELAADIQRHLHDEPVVAGPPSPWYKARKFGRRNRRALAVASLLAAFVLALGFQTAKRVEAETISNRTEAAALIEQASYLKYQKDDQAERLLDQAEALAPDLPDAEIERAYLSTIRGNPDEAESQARAILARHPDSGQAEALLCALVEREDPKQAERIWQRVARDEDEYRLFFARGLVESDHAKAIEHLQRSIELRPWQFDTAWQLAVRRFKDERFEESLRDGDLLAKVRPDLAIVPILRGASLWEPIKRLEQASLEQLSETAGAVLPEYGRAIELDPRQGLAYYNRGLVYGFIAQHKDAPDDLFYEHHDAAIADMRKAVELDPDDRDAWYELGLNLLAIKEDAGPAFDRAISLGYDTWKSRVNRARARYGTEAAIRDADMAIRMFEASGESSPDDRGDLLYVRGVASQRLRDFESAERFLSEAIDVHPNPPGRFYDDLGIALMAQRRYPAALTAFGHAVAVEPENGWYGLSRGLARWFTDDPEGAILDIEAFAGKNENYGPWFRLSIWEIEALRGHDREASTAKQAALRSGDDFLRRAVECEPTDEAEEKLVESADKKYRLNTLYWLGARALVAQDRERALRWFDACRAESRPGEFEYSICEWHLETLDA